MSNLNKARFMKGEEITTKKSNEDILDKIRKEEFGDEDYELAQEEIIPAEEHKDEESPAYKTRREENYDNENYDDVDDEDEDEEEETKEEEVEEKPAPKRKPYNRKPQQKPEPKVQSHSNSNDNPLYKKLLLKLKLELIEEARNSIEIDGFSESEIDMVWESILEDIQK